MISAFTVVSLQAMDDPTAPKDPSPDSAKAAIVSPKNISTHMFDHVEIYGDKAVIDKILAASLSGNKGKAANLIADQILGSYDKILTDTKLYSKGLIKEGYLKKHIASMQFYHSFGDVLLTTCKAVRTAEKHAKKLKEFFENSIKITQESYRNSSGETANQGANHVRELGKQSEDLKTKLERMKLYLDHLYAPINTSNGFGLYTAVRKVDRIHSTGVSTRQALTEEFIFNFFSDIETLYYQKIVNNKGQLKGEEEVTYTQATIQYVKEQKIALQKDSLEVLKSKYEKKNVPELVKHKLHFTPITPPFSAPEIKEIKMKGTPTKPEDVKPKTSADSKPPVTEGTPTSETSDASKEKKPDGEKPEETKTEEKKPEEKEPSAAVSPSLESEDDSSGACIIS